MSISAISCAQVTGNVGCRVRIEGIDEGGAATPDHALATALAAALLVRVWSRRAAGRLTRSKLLAKRPHSGGH